MIITIGNFDGVHRGHQALIRRAQEMAKKQNSGLRIFTFWPHSGDRIPGRKTSRIFTRDLKLRLLKELAPEAVLTEYPFDETLRIMPEEVFFEKVLIQENGCTGVAVGENFRYGFEGKGDIYTLKAHCEAHGIPFEAVPGLCFTDEEGNRQRISSSVIRDLLQTGQMERAAELMGRLFFVEGRVFHGKRLGRELGFPTINLFLPEEISALRHGVYVTSAITPDGLYYGISNVGLNPTVEAGTRVKVETHLLDYEGDLYDQAVRIRFLHFMREEQRFESIEALAGQLTRDKQRARAIISLYKETL